MKADDLDPNMQTTNLNQRSVLVLCTGNSCRSQMAEAIWRNLGGNAWSAYSAGSKPTGSVHPLALSAIREIGLPLEGLSSKSVDSFGDRVFDVVITVCGHAKDSCPLLQGGQETHHWPFDDPAEASGTEAEVMDSFRRIRDQIKKQIAVYLQQTESRSQ